MIKLIIESNSPQLKDYIEDFCSFMCSELGIQKQPDITFVGRTGQASFGNYQPSSGAIVVATEGRHMCDVLRTLAHEMVHDAQMLNGQHDDPLEELELEANAVAGMAMRNYNKLHPELYGISVATSPPPGTLGDSQGAVFPDPTRPSGPIELAELSNKTLSSYKKKALQARKAGQRKWWHGTNKTGEWEFPNSGKPYPEDKTRTQGIETAIQKLKARYAHLKEDGAVVNSAGSGAIAGLGIGPQGEPGVTKKKSPILKPMLKRFKQLREELTPAQARKEFATSKKPRTAAEEAARKAFLKK